MSVVTNVMLSHDVLDDQQAGIGEPFPAGTRVAGQRLLNISDGPAADSWGGHKYPECDLWAGAFNHLDLGDLIAKVEAIPWSEPGNVQLFVQGQDDDRFAVYEFRGERLVKVL